jgi:hypothetical protein
MWHFVASLRVGPGSAPGRFKPAMQQTESQRDNESASILIVQMQYFWLTNSPSVLSINHKGRFG